MNALCKIKKGSKEKLILGNLYAKRDWGHAKDYVVAMWKILQQKKPDDFVIATGKQYSIKSFINLVVKHLNIKITWKGSGINEKAFDHRGKCIISCSKKYFRPTEVESLLGNPKKATKALKWKPTYDINLLIKEMIKEEFKYLDKN